MILGIGTDLVDIRRIEALLERHPRRFLARCFTQTDLSRLPSHSPSARAIFLAKRFAAKEAGVKALGTGFSGGITLRDISSNRVPGNPPFLILTGQAQARCHAKTPGGYESRWHVSLSDEPPYVSAYIIWEAVQL